VWAVVTTAWWRWARVPATYIASAFLCLVGTGIYPALAQTDFETPLKLQRLYRIFFGKDYATTASPDDRDAHAPSGVLFYVPAQNTDVAGTPIPGVTQLYLFNPPLLDHMDSTGPGEGGYTTEGPLGFVWTSLTAVPGLAPLTRIYDSRARY